MMENDLTGINALKDSANPEALMEAFELFNKVSSSLMESYEELKVEAGELKVEVEQKNEELRKNLDENRRLRNYLENIIQNITSGMIVVDTRGNITLSNKNAERIIRLTNKKLNDKNYKDIFRNLPDIDELKKSVNGILPLGFEFPYTNIKGEKYILGINISRVFDSRRGITGYILDFRNLNSIKALEEKAERVTRLTAMGEMAAKMAHEIRNPLGSIELFASLLKKHLADMPEKAEIAENIISGVKSLNRTVSNVLQFSRPAEASIKDVELEKILEDIVLFTSHKIQKDKIKLVTKFSKKRSPIEGDPELMKQMFSNIILNAVQAMPDGGTLSISTSYRKATENQLKIISPRKTRLKSPAYFLRVNFKDTGIGIERSELKKVFQPFFSTRKRGTGLGLSIVDKIVQQHNALIKIKSKKDEGTTVTVDLPVYK